MPLINRDLDQIAKLEKAFVEKYGREILTHPKENWNDEKEKKFLSEIENFISKLEKAENNYHIEHDGDIEYVIKKTIQSCSRNCKECGKYSLSRIDDLYLRKHNICYKCYVIKNKL